MKMTNQPTKKALLIGINYFNTGYKLYGCHNDVDMVRGFLLEVGYAQQNIKIMKDTQNKNSGSLEPSRNNILREMNTLVKSSKPGDTLYLHYSGHGSQTRDAILNMDETDGQDETLVAVTGGQIVDDELYIILVQNLPNGVKLRVCFDCCHSGSALDLPFRYLTGDQLFTENNKKCNKDIIMVSGCMDNQLSSDAWIDRQSVGALTWAYIKSLREFKQSGFQKWTWVELLMNIRHKLNKDGCFQQIPQLSIGYADILKNKICL
jgi:hypothetical protein